MGSFVQPSQLGRKTKKSYGWTKYVEQTGVKHSTGKDKGYGSSFCLHSKIIDHFFEPILVGNTPVINFPCHCLPSHIGTKSLWMFIYVFHAPISCPAVPYAKHWESIPMWSGSAVWLPSRSSSSSESASSRASVNYIHYLPQGLLLAKPQTDI